MTDKERRDLGNRMKTAEPAEYLQLVKEKAERRRAKWIAYQERKRQQQ